MSAQARIALVNACVVRDANAIVDLLEPARTRTELVALLLDAAHAARALKRYVLVTSVRSDHNDDSTLGKHSHANGWCADLWLLQTKADGDYEPGDSEMFALWLTALHRSPWCYQIGLAGECVTPHNQSILGSLGFVDSGADHVHVGAREP
jgi:hypothetical protein